MKFFLSMVLVLTIFLSCEEYEMATQNTKPVITKFNPPDSNVEPVSGVQQSGGYVDGLHKIYGKNYNAFWRQDFRVADYLLSDLRTIYVALSGNDIHGDGSIDNPFETISRASESIAKNLETEIILKESGDYPISDDVDMRGKKITIRNASGATVYLQAVSYVYPVPEKNSIKKIYIGDDTCLRINVWGIKMPAPADAGIDWASDETGIVNSALFLFTGGRGLVELFIGNGNVVFSETSASGGFPALFHVANSAVPTINISSSIETKDEGYFISYLLGAPLTFLSKINFSLDYPLKFSFGASNQILDTGNTDTSFGDFKIALPSDGIVAKTTGQLAPDVSTNDIKTAIESLLNYEIPGQSIEVDVTAHRIGSYVNGIKIEIKGGFSGKKLPIPLYVIGATNRAVFLETQKLNIVSN